MSGMDRAEGYEQRIAAQRAELSRFDAQEARIAWARLAVAGVAIALGWLVFGGAGASAHWLWIPIASFIVLLMLHERLRNRRSELISIVRFLERRLERLRGEWQGDGPDGSQFMTPDHPYAVDLDVLGRGSLFQLICVASTPRGQRRLADWLLEPCDPAELPARQQAVAELAPATALREDLAPGGEEWTSSGEGERLGRWSAAPAVRYAWYEMILTSIIGVAGLTTLIGWFIGWGATPFFVAIVAATAMTMKLKRRISVSIGEASEAGREIEALERVVKRLRREAFTSPLLSTFGSSEAGRAVDALQSLRRLIDLHHAMRNQFFVPFGALLLWTQHIAFLFERWRRRHGRELQAWIDGVATFEALSSLAVQAWEHPADTFPELVAEGSLLELEDAAHPLLPESAAVRNDIRFDHASRLYIVSGSNMSGKSTLLRSVGTNVVLAQAGCVVRAKRMRLSPMQPGASIRINDSLEEGASRFYAEIRRLRQIVDLARSGERTLLALLDEVLAGTNSHDRRIGAQAVLRRLVSDGAIGLVTTHDLALTKLADDPRIINVHFEDRLEEGRMSFDYRLKAGVVTRSNAIELMRAVGLDV